MKKLNIEFQELPYAVECDEPSQDQHKVLW